MAVQYNVYCDKCYYRDSSDRNENINIDDCDCEFCGDQICIRCERASCDGCYSVACNSCYSKIYPEGCENCVDEEE